ncbi:prepilin peptidase [Sphingomonas sp.]|uniref:A24 family peptidase n=1 Tax=Sphingomonas sp. TaxID=28214 RepID=UPI0025F001A8|nr:prepilin peptidase [Sphingomonas sp.]
MGTLHIILLTALAVVLVIAAIGDWRTRTISNWLNLAIAVGAPLWWLLNGYDLWPDVAIVFAQAVITFAIFAGMFALGAMGGGDVKMITALALWFTPIQFFNLLTVMAILGGLLTVAMLIRHKIQKSEGRPEIPYGIAIAFAALWEISQTIS